MDVRSDSSISDFAGLAGLACGWAKDWIMAADLSISSHATEGHLCPFIGPAFAISDAAGRVIT